MQIISMLLIKYTTDVWYKCECKDAIYWMINFMLTTVTDLRIYIFIYLSFKKHHLLWCNLFWIMMSKNFYIVLLIVKFWCKYTRGVISHWFETWESFLTNLFWKTETLMIALIVWIGLMWNLCEIVKTKLSDNVHETKVDFLSKNQSKEQSELNYVFFERYSQT